MKKKMKELVMIGVLTSFVMLNSGCVATFMEVKSFNRGQDDKYLNHEIKARADGQGAEVRGAIDVRELPEFAKGYWSCWRNNAGGMAKSAAIDTAWMGTAYYLYNENSGSSSRSSDLPQNVNVEGDSNNLIFNTGDGNDFNQGATVLPPEE